MRKQNGITIVALVITIIVLLILVGFSIAMLAGSNGFLTSPRQNQTSTTQKNNEEIVKLAVENLINEYNAGSDIAANITNTNNSPSTLEINKEELKSAIYRTTSDANLIDVIDATLNIAEDDLEEEVFVLKVDFAEGQDIYVIPSTGQIVTQQG